MLYMIIEMGSFNENHMVKYIQNGLQHFEVDAFMNELSDYSHAVAVIKAAVEQSRYRALQAGNAEMLSLYYGIGKYVSENTRNGV